MKLNIAYKHLEPTPSIENKISEKADHLRKYFRGDVEVNWVCSVDKNFHRSEVNVHAGHNYFHAKAENSNLYKTMDEVIAKVERQVRRKNKKLNDKIHSHSNVLSFY